MAKKITVEQMLEAGLHFGHQTHRWHPKMKPFIFDSRDGVHIIDLTKTESQLKEAVNFVTDLASNGKLVMLVGTKRQAIKIVEEAAKAAELPYAAERWPGGLLTNFSTMRKRIKHLKELREKFAKKDFGDLTKQEIGLLEKKLAILETAFGGLDMLNKVPDALIITDVVREKIAVKEAQKLGIPIIGIVDTNANPEGIDYVIPGNDDSKQGTELIVNTLVDAFKENRAKAAPEDEPNPKAKKEPIKKKAKKAPASNEEK
ncbi:MAG: 30S ribosomal protein S2 [Patescibacteria group bacterium]|nr:30S ribosomal protein S2 [Patescibacteria group bacterium]